LWYSYIKPKEGWKTLQLNELNVLYINNPISFSNDVDEYLENTFNNYFDVTTFEDSIRIFKDEFIDLLLIDIDYSEANGLKFLNVIKQKVPDFPVILFSRNDLKDIKKTIGELPVNAIIQTPYEVSTLAEKIEQIQDKIIQFASSRADRNKEPEATDLGMEASIDLFFKRFNDELRKAHTRKVKKKMDFSIMKTFLYTAYNNFNDFDSKFDDDALKLAKRNLEKAMKLKRDLERKLACTLEDNYEMVYLNQQAEYLRLKHDYEESIRKIQQYRDSLALLTNQIEGLKEELKKLSKQSEEYGQADKSLKEANKKQVDRVHHIAGLKQTIDALDEQIDAYKAKYFDEFKTVFMGKTDQIKAEIIESLNFAAYAFDKEIWRRAKLSRPVKDFFAEAKINGLFSSKTYLEYFSGNIDTAITSGQNKKILHYLNDLNKNNKIRIAFICEDHELIKSYKIIIEKIDRSILLSGFIDPKRALNQHKATPFDLIIVDEQVGKTPGFDIIQQFKETYREDILETEFCINMPDKKRSKSYSRAQEMGINHFIHSEMNSGELAKKMLEIL
jgi:DNA-binding NarL/FixJ family response regulator